MTTSLHIREYNGYINPIMPLLLVCDESEQMVRGYIGSCTIYVGTCNNDIVAVCAVMETEPGTVEVKNLAVTQSMRRQGIGRAMLNHVESALNPHTISLGTGETPSTLRFYKSCGYEVSHIIPGFFTDNYPAPIIEEGVRLRDMICLVKHPQH